MVEIGTAFSSSVLVIDDALRIAFVYNLTVLISHGSIS
jgi:hypothetical protein